MGGARVAFARKWQCHAGVIRPSHFFRWSRQLCQFSSRPRGFMRLLVSCTALRSNLSAIAKILDRQSDPEKLVCNLDYRIRLRAQHLPIQVANLASSRSDVRIRLSSPLVISSFEVDDCRFNCFLRILFCSPLSADLNYLAGRKAQLYHRYHRSYDRNTRQHHQ
jgi:hypothetical protein